MIWLDEYETTAGSQTASGLYLKSRVLMLAQSKEEAHSKLMKCNRTGIVGWPPRKTGRGAFVEEHGILVPNEHS